MNRPFRRVIACLDVKDGRVVKGTAFESLRDCGDPALLAHRYEEAGADEIVFLDIAATVEGRRALLPVIERTASSLFIPLTVGGGVSDLAGASQLLRSGADKVAVNSAAVRRPALIDEIAQAFGAQCVVLAIDARRDDSLPSRRRVVVNGGRTDTALDAVEWARTGERLGAGELLLTSIESDGARTGYDLDWLSQVRERCDRPLIASGGAGRSSHLVAAFAAGADACLVAGILHDGTTTIPNLKSELAEAGIVVRAVPQASVNGRAR